MKVGQSFFEDSLACLWVRDDVSEWFPVNVGLRQGCVMSSWSFNVHIKYVMCAVLCVSLCTPLCWFVAAMHLFSQSLSIVLWCGGLQLNVIFRFSSVRCILWPGFALIRLSCSSVIYVKLYTSYRVNSNSNHCLFSKLPSASVRVRHSRAAHSLEFEVSRCRT